MAITVQTDITANGLYVGAQANKTAFQASNLLRSGFVTDASAIGTLSPKANKVSFPVWDFSGVASADLPSDGSAVTAGKSTFAYIDETCEKSIVSTEAMESAIETGVGGVTNFLDQLSIHVGNKLATDIEDSLYAKAKALATAASQVVSDYNAANISYEAIVRSAATKWGAHWRPQDCALVLHSLVYATLLEDPDYKASITHSKQDLAGEPAPTFMGMLIVPCDSVDVTTGVYDNLIIRRNTLKVFMNGDVKLKTAHIPGSDTEAYDAIYSFATHAGRNYPTGAIVLQTTAA